jgi:hypothetical protein
MYSNNTYKTECGHIFHGGCIDKWLEEKTTCPVCRNTVDKVRFKD